LPRVADTSSHATYL